MCSLIHGGFYISIEKHKKNIPVILFIIIKAVKSQNFLIDWYGTYQCKIKYKNSAKIAQKDKKRTPHILLGIKLLVYQQKLKKLVRCWYV